VAFSRQTAYGQIADAIRADILAGAYEPSPDDPTRNELPGAAELGSQYGVSDKTAARAVQQLITEGSSSAGRVCARWLCHALSGRTAGR
jgi:DNA-binding GntR family transcriptional regulator